MLGHPGDVFVELDHPVAEFRHLDEPRRHRFVDEWVCAPPAVRVAVVVAVGTNQLSSCAQIFDDGLVCIEDVLACIVGHRRVELAGGVDRVHRLDASSIADGLVVLAECGCNVHDAGAVFGGDKVGGQHLVRVWVVWIVGEESEQRHVPAPGQL